MAPPPSGTLFSLRWNVPFRNVPKSYPLTWQFVMATFSVARAKPSAFNHVQTWRGGNPSARSVILLGVQDNLEPRGIIISNRASFRPIL